MSQLQRGETFIDGQVVTAARLNNLVDLATGIQGFIMDRPSATSAMMSDGDQLLLWDDSSNQLKRVAKSVFLASAVGVTSVALTMPGTFTITGSPVTSTGTLAVGWATQAKNKVLIGPATGANAAPTWRTLGVNDATIPTVTIAADIIDWSLGNTFYKWLTANSTFYFTNPTEGQRIAVRMQNGASWSVIWLDASLRWPHGTVPVMTTGAGRGDVYNFHYIGGTYLGSFDQDY